MTSREPASHSPTDVRMKGFSRRATLGEAQAWLEPRLQPLPPEKVGLGAAHGRVLAEDIISDVDVPQFTRSMMDGFAVVAADTEGATAYNRLPLTVVDTSLPGVPATREVKPGEAIRIMTGAPVPSGADAVLPVEIVEVEGDRIFVQAAVPSGKNIGVAGEDIARGTTTLQSGRRLRPQDIGVLSSIGIADVNVIRRPRVRIVVTGNELLPAGERPSGYKIIDANGPMLTALIERDGGIASHPGIVPDTPESIIDALHDDADIVIVSGGSSVGQEDYAPSLVREHGELGIHGIAMRPSSPTGMGVIAGRLVFLLPGNPVSCLCAYDFFAGRAIRALGGLRRTWPYQSRRLPLKRKLVSAIGRVDYARVRIVDDEVEPLAISGASMLSSTTRADGFVIVPEDSEGHGPGTHVKVYPYDEQTRESPDH